MHCKSYSHFFSKKFQHICVSPDVNFNESLTNDIVSFEQLGPGVLLFASALKPFLIETFHKMTTCNFASLRPNRLIDGSLVICICQKRHHSKMQFKNMRRNVKAMQYFKDMADRMTNFNAHCFTEHVLQSTMEVWI